MEPLEKMDQTTQASHLHHHDLLGQTWKQTQEVVKKAPFKRIKRKVCRITGKENLDQCDQSKCSSKTKLASKLNKHFGHVQRKEGLITCKSKEKESLEKFGFDVQLEGHGGAALLKKKPFKCHV